MHTMMQISFSKIYGRNNVPKLAGWTKFMKNTFPYNPYSLPDFPIFKIKTQCLSLDFAKQIMPDLPNLLLHLRLLLLLPVNFLQDRCYQDLIRLLRLASGSIVLYPDFQLNHSSISFGYQGISSTCRSCT